jgi:hypothetical protein
MKPRCLSGNKGGPQRTDLEFKGSLFKQLVYHIGADSKAVKYINGGTNSLNCVSTECVVPNFM